VVLVDATQDGNPPGSFRRLVPRFSSDYPPTLTAHDIGLKDLLDCFYLTGEAPEVVLYAVSIPDLYQLDLDMSPEVALRVPEVAAAILDELASLDRTQPA